MDINGEIWAPIRNNDRSILQKITKEIFGEIKSQQITLWDVDMLERYTENILCGSLVFEGNLIEGNLEESPDLIRDAWFYANKKPHQR